MAGAGDEAAGAPPAWTFWVEGPRRRARLVLRGSFFVVGRLEPFLVFQDDPMISREHLAVVAVGGGVRARDLGSRNGVLVNGKRLERYAEVPLAPGDVLHVGQTALRLLREGEREPAAHAGEAAEAEADEVTVDEDGQTRSRLRALDAAAAAAALGAAADPGESSDLGESSDVGGEATGELDVPDLDAPEAVEGAGLADAPDAAEVEAVAAAVRAAAATAAAGAGPAGDFDDEAPTRPIRGDGPAVDRGAETRADAPPVRAAAGQAGDDRDDDEGDLETGRLEGE